MWKLQWLEQTSLHSCNKNCRSLTVGYVTRYMWWGKTLNVACRDFMQIQASGYSLCLSACALKKLPIQWSRWSRGLKNSSTRNCDRCFDWIKTHRGVSHEAEDSSAAYSDFQCHSLGLIFPDIEWWNFLLSSSKYKSETSSLLNAHTHAHLYFSCLFCFLSSLGDRNSSQTLLCLRFFSMCFPAFRRCCRSHTTGVNQWTFTQFPAPALAKPWR